MFLKKKIVYVVIFLLTTSFLYYFIKNYQDDRAKTQIGGNFQLTNHLGEKVNNNSFNGYNRLVFFGFTNCPDFCPNTLNNIGTIINEVKKNVDLIPIFITVDPKRDTTENLKNYLENFHPKIIGLTGSTEEINDVKEKYKIFSKKVIDTKNKEKHNHKGHDHGGYSVDHTTIIYLMNKKGRYITHFSPDAKNLEIIKKINKIL